MLEQKDLEMIAGIVEKTVVKVVEPMKQEIREVKKEVAEVKSDLTEVKKEVAEVKSDLTEVKREVAEVKSDLTEVKLTLENEVNKKINIIAEGHLDLNRKFDEALKIESEKEMMNLRITILENDVRRLQEKVNQTA